MKMIDNGNGPWEKVRCIWEIIDRLRGEPGCPWDKKQTPQTVQTYLVEEAHEAASAIRDGSVHEAAEELGDLLFMVFFMIHLYEEQKDFRLEEVSDAICEKMIRRHPHVFGDTTVHSAQEVRVNWERIKADEKAASGKTSKAGGIPSSLPALMRAYRIVSRASQKEGASWDDLDAHVRAFSRKSRELCTQLAGDAPVPEAAFGDLLLELVNLARIEGYRAEDSLQERLRSMEATSSHEEI